MAFLGCFTFKKPSFVCGICVKFMNIKKSFNISGCSHSYCKYCIAKYIDSSLQNNVTTIRCPVPDCENSGKLEINHCRKILGKSLFDKWGFALCEDAVSGGEKVYCPFKDCSALLIDDGREVITECECPNCHRLFCAQCKVSWHAGMSCVQFRELVTKKKSDQRENEDVMLMKLADRMQWQRCPNCRVYVERKDGCNYMTCRCGVSFCYRCGTRSNKFMRQHHYCTTCKR